MTLIITKGLGEDQTLITQGYGLLKISRVLVLTLTLITRTIDFAALSRKLEMSLKKRKMEIEFKKEE